MEKLLSEKFYNNFNTEVLPKVEDDAIKKILEKVDWEKEAQNCFNSLNNFFANTTKERLKNYEIDKIGVIDICWNEYGSDIEVDYMPSNNFEEAYSEGCIMNDSAIDNDKFFKTYFDVSGKDAWEKIGGAYHQIILTFDYLIEDIIAKVAENEGFKKLPIKSPCHMGFAHFHDSERWKIHTIA